eukprot:SAG11_NODE_20169_length_451_cov_0.974432_1_plen_61_part_01
MTVCAPVLYAGAYAAAARKLRPKPPMRVKDLRDLCASRGLPLSKGSRHFSKAELLSQLRSA